MHQRLLFSQALEWPAPLSHLPTLLSSDLFSLLLVRLSILFPRWRKKRFLQVFGPKYLNFDKRRLNPSSLIHLGVFLLLFLLLFYFVLFYYVMLCHPSILRPWERDPMFPCGMRQGQCACPSCGKELGWSVQSAGRALEHTGIHPGVLTLRVQALLLTPPIFGRDWREGLAHSTFLHTCRPRPLAPHCSPSLRKGSSIPRSPSDCQCLPFLPCHRTLSVGTFCTPICKQFPVPYFSHFCKSN